MSDGAPWRRAPWLRLLTAALLIPALAGTLLASLPEAGEEHAHEHQLALDTGHVVDAKEHRHTTAHLEEALPCRHHPCVVCLKHLTSNAALRASSAGHGLDAAAVLAPASQTSARSHAFAAGVPRGPPVRLS